jgi:Ca2+-binding EF-hand superfamily protein
MVLEKQAERDEKPSSSVESAFASLLSKELGLVSDLAETAEELLNAKDFTTYEAFLSIDLDNTKYIDEKSLEAFLAKHGNSLTDQDIMGIIYRLDADMDKRVSYEEFQQLFLPIKQHGETSFSRGYGTKTNEFDSLRYSQTCFYNSRNDGFKSTLKASQQGFSSDYKKSPVYQGSVENFFSTNSSLGRSNYSPLKKTEEVLNKSYSPLNDKSYVRSQSQYSSRERVSPRASPRYDTYARTEYSPVNNLSNSRTRFSPIGTRSGFSGYKRFSPYKTTSLLDRSRQHTYTSPLRTANYDIIYNSSGKLRNLSSTEYKPYVSPRRRHLVGRSTSPVRPEYNASNTLLARFLHEVVTQDVATETYREALSIKSDVSLRDLFTYLDISGRNSISVVDFSEVLKELGIYSSLDDVKLIFKRYDGDMDGRIE